MEMAKRDLSELSAEEREKCLEKMKAAKDIFYALAVGAGHHQFVEFAGLMNEYIKLCELAHEKGIDFVTNFAALPCPEYCAEYLGEKMNCIYGRWFQKDEKLRTAFVEVFFGLRAYPNVDTGP